MNRKYGGNIEPRNLIKRRQELRNLIDNNSFQVIHEEKRF